MAVNSYTMDALDNFTREELPSAIKESLPQLDPVHAMIQSSSIGVTRSDIGRDWEVMHLFATGVAGLINNADPRGPAMLDRAEFYQSLLLDSTDTSIAPFPNALNTPHTSSLLRRLYLHMSVGNLGIPITWIQGEQLSSNQIRQVALDIRKVGEGRALQEATSFFMPANNCVAQIDNWTTGQGKTTANAASTFTVKAGTGRTQYFRVGQMVDILADSGGTPQFGTATNGSDRRNYSTSYYPLIISNVNYLTGVITVSSTANADISGLSIADDDWIILRDNHVSATREMRTYGLNDWIKASGQIMGGSATIGNILNPGLDIDSQSQFASHVKAVNAPITDSVLNTEFGLFAQAYTGSVLDTIVTTMGVQMKYLESPTLSNNRMVWERQGNALDYVGGWDRIMYTFGGQRFKWLVSNLCLGGHLYGLKLANSNIKRYIPPRIGATNDEVGSEVEFVASLPQGNNGGSIFKLAHSSAGQTTVVLEAPFMEYVLVAPVDVRSIKLTGCTEAAGF